MKNKVYRLAYIYIDHVIDCMDIAYKEYSKAYKDAIKQMQQEEGIVSTLIYSNKNTAIVIQRKHADLVQ